MKLLDDILGSYPWYRKLRKGKWQLNWYRNKGFIWERKDA